MSVTRKISVQLGTSAELVSYDVKFGDTFTNLKQKISDRQNIRPEDQLLSVNSFLRVSQDSDCIFSVRWCKHSEFRVTDVSAPVTIKVEIFDSVKVIDVRTCMRDTIADFKRQIEADHQIPVCDQRIYTGGLYTRASKYPVEDSITILDSNFWCRVKPVELVNLGQPTKLNIAISTGEIFKVKVKVGDSVKSVKERILAKKGIALEHQRLTLDNNLLRDEDTLFGRDITAKSKLYMIFLNAPIVLKIEAPPHVFTSKIGPDDTIKKLKRRLQQQGSQHRFSPDCLLISTSCASYHGYLCNFSNRHSRWIEMPDFDTISNYDLRGEPKMVVLDLAGQICITVNFFRIQDLAFQKSHSCTVSVLANSTIRQLKEKIQEAENVKFKNQFLLQQEHHAEYLYDFFRLIESTKHSKMHDDAIVSDCCVNLEERQLACIDLSSQFDLPVEIIPDDSSNDDPEVILVNVRMSDTILEVKKRIEVMKRLPHHEQIIFFPRWRSSGSNIANAEGRFTLFDKVRILDLDYQRLRNTKLCVEMLDRKKHVGQIFIKTLSGATITFQCDARDPVEVVKKFIQERENIPPDLQRLIYGTQLDGRRAMLDYNVQPCSTLHLCLRLRGNGDMASSHVLRCDPPDKSSDVSRNTIITLTLDRNIASLISNPKELQLTAIEQKPNRKFTKVAVPGSTRVFGDTAEFAMAGDHILSPGSKVTVFSCAISNRQGTVNTGHSWQFTVAPSAPVQLMLKTKDQPDPPRRLEITFGDNPYEELRRAVVRALRVHSCEVAAIMCEVGDDFCPINDSRDVIDLQSGTVLHVVKRDPDESADQETEEVSDESDVDDDEHNWSDAGMNTAVPSHESIDSQPSSPASSAQLGSPARKRRRNNT